jgi:multidrug resistance efflux pump
MSEAAHVTSIPALAELRAALLNFADETKDALAAVEMEIHRTFDWLGSQLQSWKQEVRLAEDAVFEAQQELARRKMMRVGGRPVDCTDQEKALRRARARLEHAEEQRERTQRWLRDLPADITEYEGRGRQLQNLVEGELPRTCALLEHMIGSLEAYVELRSAPPSEPSSARSSAPAEPNPPAAPERKVP